MQPNIRFDSLTDLIDYARGADACPNAQAFPRSSRDGKADFNGVPLEEAFQLAVNGWKAGRERIQSVIDSAPACHVRKNRVAWRPANSGGPLDIGRYLQGNPDCFMRPVYSAPARGQRIIRIAVGTYLANKTHDQIFARGAAICMLVDRLENSGYRVELVFSRRVANGSREWCMDCTVKRDTDALDLDMLAFVFANPAMMRRLAFAVAEREPAETRKQFDFITGEGYSVSVAPKGDYDLIIDGSAWCHANIDGWMTELGIDKD